VDSCTTVPSSIEAVTPQWLSAVLSRSGTPVRVSSLSTENSSAGTSVRARLLLTYSSQPVGSVSPPTLFAKSAPTLVTRVANGLTRTAPAEAGFYGTLRPLLQLEAPHGYYGASDPRSFRAIHLLEDLDRTRAATFCTPVTAISREQAELIVEQLALLHGQAASLGFVHRRPRWLRTYPRWWRDAGAVSNIRRYHLRGQLAADNEEITPPRLRGRGESLWRSFTQSVAAHKSLHPTLIHSDPHLGNWFITGGGAMGLCDWQCISIGHWSRDLAYTLASALTIEQRRSWERDLIASYLQRLEAAGGNALAFTATWDLYRKQLVAALLMWTPTHSPPPMFPAMQPKSTSTEMLRRILTAVDDLDG